VKERKRERKRKKERERKSRNNKRKRERERESERKEGLDTIGCKFHFGQSGDRLVTISSFVHRG